ncbi:MAG: DUF4365 domain-containing protein [Deltaproteobacteria bacterium]|nr:DUF4365 domain-containing protein [Deltaproteobacteria bacterium]
MNISHQQEEFSRAFVHAVASAAGFKVQAGATPDDDSVDLTISSRGPLGTLRSPRLDVQLKCTMTDAPAGDLTFRLKTKNYRDLSGAMSEFQVPRVLIVVCVPHAVQRWVSQQPDSLILRHAAYWMCLHGSPATTNTATVSVVLPGAQRFTVDGLQAMMARVAQGERP